MRLLLRLVTIAVLAGVGWVLFAMMPSLHATDVHEFWKVALCFGGIILVTLGGGVVLVLWILPALGEWIGGLFYNPNQQIEKGPHDDAIAMMAQGDFTGAIEEYHEAFEKDPTDTLALSEIARIYCEKLDAFDMAAAGLEQALEKEWPQDQAAFLASRLVDVYWNHMHDGVRARTILLQIAESMPETRHSANALHRLNDIDRAMNDEIAASPLHEQPFIHQDPTEATLQPPAVENPPPAPESAV